MELDEVARSPLTDAVIRAIQDLILSGDVLPGEYLPPQQQLAMQLKVGLSTVREAIKALSVIGLLKTTSGRGTMVMPAALAILSSEAAMKANLASIDVNEILESRFILESALTRAAAERAQPEDLIEIESHFQQMHASVCDQAAFARADMRFHLAVARASKNQVLALTYYLIQSLLQEVIEEADALPGGIDRAMHNHGEILEGIRNRQPGRAAAASERQICDMADFLENGTLSEETITGARPRAVRVAHDQDGKGTRPHRTSTESRLGLRAPNKILLAGGSPS